MAVSKGEGAVSLGRIKVVCSGASWFETLPTLGRWKLLTMRDWRLALPLPTYPSRRALAERQRLDRGEGQPHLHPRAIARPR